MKHFIAIATIIMIQSSSCGIMMDIKASNANDNLMKLNIGDIRETVIGIMGKPGHNEKYLIDDKIYDIYYYRTSRTADGKETDDEFTPVVLIDGKLVGWGRNYYDNTIKIKIETKK